MKKFSRVLICFTVIIAMLASIGLCSFADEPKKVYTCLGDSNSAGHGLDGWHVNRLPVPGAYHSIIAEEMDLELRPFGSGGYRSDEIRYILDPEFEMDWSYAEICNGEVHKDKIDEYKDRYVQAVVDADYITIQVGANDIMGDALGFAYFVFYTPIAEIEELKAKFDGTGALDELMLKVLNAADTVARAASFVAELYKNIQATYPEFRENWDAIIENIYRLNPDVEIVALSAVNSFNNVSFLIENSPIKGGKIFDFVIAKLNNWIEYGSEYADTYKYCDVTDFEFTPLYLQQPDFWDIYLPLVHPNAEQHAQIADRVLALFNDTAPEKSPVEVALGKAYAALLGK